MAAQEKTRLDALVTAGKITSDQETAIINELAALKTKYSATSMSGLTPAQRKTQMTARRDEIVAWAKSQGIDSSYIMGGFGIGEEVQEWEVEEKVGWTQRNSQSYTNTVSDKLITDKFLFLRNAPSLRGVSLFNVLSLIQ